MNDTWTIGWVSRLHPLTKLALLLAAILVSFADLGKVQGVPLLSWVLLFVLVVIAFSDSVRTGRRVLFFTLSFLVPLFISFIVLLGLFYPGPSLLLWEWGWLSVKQVGVVQGMVLLARAALAAGATILVLTTTDSADLTLALTQLGIPREFAYVILAALQLLPRMQARAQSILSAQSARGLQTEGNVVVRLRSLIPLAGPLITSALNETNDRALALEVRAFRTNGPKTSWRILHDTAPQRLIRWLLVLTALAVFLWSLFF